MQSEVHNPLGTDGFEFVEYAHEEPGELRAFFESFGFAVVARHRRKDVTLHKQGNVHFLVNGEPRSFAQRFAKQHGPSVCALGFRVKDSASAFEGAVQAGAEPVPLSVGPMELYIPAIMGVGGSRIYLIDRYGERSIYDVDFVFEEDWAAKVHQANTGITEVDHVTHNVFTGNMDNWARFYEEVFGFREIRHFDIEGVATGLLSRAMTSPCGKIRIPINESQDSRSQVFEYLKDYRGEGIQHIALHTDDIYGTVDRLRQNGLVFQQTPDAYYDDLDARVPGHGEDVARLRERAILLDGAPDEGAGTLLQIFTQTVIGPIFFEIIERKGNDGFGGGNFQALFESIERDQIRRGVVDVKGEGHG